MPVVFRAWYKPEKKMYYRAYQKWFHVILCDDDHGKNNGLGIFVKKVAYEDCELLQSTFLKDKHGCEIFEGDVVKVCYKDKIIQDIVGEIPDMFKSRGLHPLHSIFQKQGLDIKTDACLDLEILKHKFV